MKKIIIICVSVLGLLIASYFIGANYYQVRSSNFSYVPYKGNEVLYFGNAKDSFVMQLDGYRNSWYYVWNNIRGIEYHLIGYGHSFQGKGIICTFFAKENYRDVMVFNGFFDNINMNFQFSPTQLHQYEKVVNEYFNQAHDIYKIPTVHDTTFFENSVKSLYWSPTKGMMGFEFVGKESPYLLKKVEYHFD